MSKSRAGALITLNNAARQAGIGPQLAQQLANDGEFPHLVELRGRRYVGRLAFQRWLAAKLSEQPRDLASGNAPQRDATI